ncbi:MAG: TlyA family RNA methyltransferase [bacterium]
MTPPRERLDQVLVRQGLALSRSEARGLIMSGRVLLQGRKLEKCGQPVAVDASLELVGQRSRFVGRGGLKLEQALKTFGIDPVGKQALDVGASTGGFTDCLLQYGAAAVTALDVGYGQLAWKLRSDSRVSVLERTNIRLVNPDDFPAFDIIVIDVSFISLKLVLPVVSKMLSSTGEIIALIKPQFEVGKGEVGKGGIVRDPEKYKQVFDSVAEFARSSRLELLEIIDSPLTGAKGNREFLARVVRT